MLDFNYNPESISIYLTDLRHMLCTYISVLIDQEREMCTKGVLVDHFFTSFFTPPPFKFNEH